MIKSGLAQLELCNENKHKQNKEEISKLIKSLPLCTDKKPETVEKIHYGDLYVIGAMWIGALQTALIGTQFDIIPKVSAAAKQPEVPQRPPKMKYTDLPIYKTPHVDFKDYDDDRYKCPDRNVKLLQRMILPTVSNWRKCAMKSLCDLKCGLRSTVKEVSADMAAARNRILAYFRDPKKLEFRQGVVAAGGLAGLYLGRRKGRIFYTTLGVLAAGFLCFPDETDEAVRTAIYHSGKGVIALLNGIFCNPFWFRERLPCESDMPIDKKAPLSKCPLPKK